MMCSKLPISMTILPTVTIYYRLVMVLTRSWMNSSSPNLAYFLNYFLPLMLLAWFMAGVAIFIIFHCFIAHNHHATSSVYHCVISITNIMSVECAYSSRIIDTCMLWLENYGFLLHYCLLTCWVTSIAQSRLFWSASYILLESALEFPFYVFLHVSVFVFCFFIFFVYLCN